MRDKQQKYSDMYIWLNRLAERAETYYPPEGRIPFFEKIFERRQFNDNLNYQKIKENNKQRDLQSVRGTEDVNVGMQKKQTFVDKRRNQNH